MVICTGNDMSRNTRPAIAGLNRFWPRPPNDILTTPIANRAPANTIHQGVVEGRFMASRRPVTSADQPLNISGFFMRYLAMSHSRPMQKTALSASTISSDQP